MKYKTKNTYQVETHPWKPYIPGNANKLIIGTFPTRIEKRKVDFYYPNPSNKFWTILSQIANDRFSSENETANSVGDRKKILDALKMGITDICSKILRHNNISSDQNIFLLEYTDIFQILDQYPKINKLIFSSTSSGNSALGWFKSYCHLNNIDISVPKSGKNPRTTYLNHNGKKIVVIGVSSTSRLVQISNNDLLNMYKSAISDNS